MLAFPVDSLLERTGLSGLFSKAKLLTNVFGAGFPFIWSLISVLPCSGAAYLQACHLPKGDDGTAIINPPPHKGSSQPGSRLGLQALSEPWAPSRGCELHCKQGYEHLLIRGHGIPKCPSSWDLSVCSHGFSTRPARNSAVRLQRKKERMLIQGTHTALGLWGRMFADAQRSLLGGGWKASGRFFCDLRNLDSGPGFASKVPLSSIPSNPLHIGHCWQLQEH